VIGAVPVDVEVRPTIRMASFTSRPAFCSAASARSRSAPVTAWTIRTARSRSFAFVARTSTMRLPYVLPSRTIAIVEIRLRTSFWAVPALSRVEPARTSGPTGTSIGYSASPLSGVARLQESDTVSAPRRRAARTAET
jgi:hypothetical protein